MERDKNSLVIEIILTKILKIVLKLKITQERYVMQMKTVAHHQPMPSHFPSSAPPRQPPPQLCIAQHEVIWYGIRLWSITVSCPSCVPSQLLLHPQPTRWWVSVRNRRGLDSV